ncbi:hypothetical protein GCM10027267_20620 [Paramicrobacterium agarici]|nr:ATP-binding protein [Microbacterium agarici]
MVSRAVFMCGPAGSGKTTVAMRLVETEGLTRLSVDEEAWKRGFRSYPIPVQDAEEIDVLLRERLTELLTANRGVVLDYSFATRAVRDDYRAFVAAFGVVPEIVFVDTPRDVALQRIRERRGEDANDAVLSVETARRFYDDFEIPTPSEGPLTVVSGA